MQNSIDEKTEIHVTIINHRPVGYLAIPEFARKCGVKTLTVNQWINRKKISSLKIGRDHWIDEQTPYPEKRKRTRPKGLNYKKGGAK